jgi:NAD(P)-dependent dehydrogenase (short-subunit alcohol dehydrogenase family)
MSGKRFGKLCLVTGSSGSMGRASAVTFAREGALLVGCGIDLVVDGGMKVW